MRLKTTIIFLVLTLCLNNLWAGEIQGKVFTRKIKSLEDVLIYIENVAGKDFLPPVGSPKMDQKNLVFVPRVLPVLKGTTVEFHNNDNARHNVLGAGTDSFDVGTCGQGVTKSHTFNKLGEVAILCNIHTEMEAFVVVLQNPYFVLADKEGNYKIENVPAGIYKLRTWHDKLKPQIKEITVPEQGSVAVDFNPP